MLARRRGRGGDGGAHRGRRLAAGRAVDEGEDLGDGAEGVGRDELADLGGGEQAARERRVLDDRDAVLAGGRDDPEGDVVGALGHHLRGRQGPGVAQRDGEVGRVGDDDVRVGDGGHHPAHGHLVLAALQLALHLGVDVLLLGLAA